MTTKAKEAGKTTYLVIMRDGTKQKLTCPTKWKVTFGPLCPGRAISLRFYDGTHQKAVFTNVESFRDMSIGIEVEVEKVQSETFYKDNPEGGDKKQVVVEGRTREWTNPDAPNNLGKPLYRSNMPGLLAVEEKRANPSSPVWTTGGKSAR